jgi:hypothetical protein
VTITSLVISDDVLHRATCVCGPGYAQGDNLAQRGIPKTPRELTGDTCIRFRFPSDAYRDHVAAPASPLCGDPE